MRGNPDAVASAYSLDDYRIADGPRRRGGLREPARPRLGARHPPGQRHGPQPHGHRLALGHRAPRLVPLGAASRPTPSYTFDGPDLSDGRARRRSSSRTTTGTTATPPSSSSGPTAGPATTRYVYHGNDGTSFPWNDTAQLDFLKAEVREAGHPDDPRRRAALPDHPLRRRDGPRQASTSSGSGGRSRASGGGIPSRAEHAITKARVRRALMPIEFWREVVDRVAAEVPGTLLLAEAFWMLEGYFVRTLGMHRVYNSAFMHMLRDEDDAGYRRVITRHARVRPGDPQALRQLHEQPGRGRPRSSSSARATSTSASATLMATMPGLPMLGHGQVAGLRREVRDGVPPRDARRAAGPVAGRAARARDLPAAAPPDVVRRGERLPALRLRDRRRHGRRGRLRLLERRRADAVAGALPRPLRHHDRDDPRVGAGGEDPGRRAKAAGPSVARGRPGAAERRGRCSWSSAMRGPGSNRSGRAARSASVACG